jgi:hypothetical protein
MLKTTKGGNGDEGEGRRGREHGVGKKEESRTYMRRVSKIQPIAEHITHTPQL